MKPIEQIQSEVENFLQRGCVFEYILKSNPSIYYDSIIKISDGITSPEDIINLVYFEYKPEDIMFSGNPFMHRFFTNDFEKENYYYEALYISDFEFKGLIGIPNKPLIKLKIDATVVIFVRNIILPPVNMVLVPDLFDVMDKESYFLWDKNQKQNELIKLQQKFNIKF